MPTHKLTPEIVTAAIVGFEQQKLRIDAQIAELRQMLTGTPTDPTAAPEAPKGKRRMSAAARKRIGDAQRKRWAESKKESVPSSPVAPEAPKPKRKLSAAGKAAIVAALKKRWAAKRAAAEKAAKA
jgi:alkylated DNA repair dioxygenase AlkB